MTQWRLKGVAFYSLFLSLSLYIYIYIWNIYIYTYIYIYISEVVKCSSYIYIYIYAAPTFHRPSGPVSAGCLVQRRKASLGSSVHHPSFIHFYLFKFIGELLGPFPAWCALSPAVTFSLTNWVLRSCALIRGALICSGSPESVQLATRLRGVAIQVTATPGRTNHSFI